MNLQVNERAATWLHSDLPAEDLPSARLGRFGSAPLADYELLSLLIGHGVRGISPTTIAYTLLERFDGNLPKLLNATTAELMTVRGIGKATACKVEALGALFDRAKREAAAPQKLNAPSLVAEYLHSFYDGLQREEVRVILLDTRNHLISNRRVSVGTLTASQVHPREVFRPAIREAAARIILAHNHPSGDPSPSKQDISVTKTVHEAGEIVGIPLVDHVIIGDKRHEGSFYASLRQLGHCG